MNLKKVKDLDIAKTPFELSNEIKEELNYQKWVDYITENNDYFVWYENTKEGKEILGKADTIPEDFRNNFLSMLNKVRCFADFNPNKNIYEISLGFNKETKRISVTFNRFSKVEDLKRLLVMAKHLDALLLKDGTEIIDEKEIERLGVD